RRDFGGGARRRGSGTRLSCQQHRRGRLLRASGLPRARAHSLQARGGWWRPGRFRLRSRQSRTKDTAAPGAVSRARRSCWIDPGDTGSWRGLASMATMNSRGRPCKLGVILPEAEFDMGGETARWSDYRAMARLAEDMGFDSVWFVDHLLYRGADATTMDVQGTWECWSILAALAAVTERVELGPLVTPTSFRNPALFAKMVATIEEISGGRIILGLGAGWHKGEYDAFGFPFDHRVARFEEAFTIIHSLLRHGQVDFEGQYYSARECELRPRGPRPNGPPLMI